MTDLYYRPGEVPAVLPFEAQTPDGYSRTDLANQPDSIAECGFVLAPPKPGDTADQIAEWDAAVEAWRMVDRPPAPEVPPTSEAFPPITPRQFFQALSLSPYAIITRQEALDAVKTGEIPAIMQDVIDTLPDEASQYAATMLIAGGQQFNRDDPLVAIFGASQRMDDAAIDAFWRFARSL